MPSRLVVRLVLASTAVVLLLSVAASPVSAVGGAWPYQDAGDRGTNVKVVQLLLRAHRYDLPVSGVFGTATRDALRSFQSHHGLAASGVATPTTWGELVVPLTRGARGDAVRAVQLLIHQKRDSTLPVTGFFGPLTRSAVIALQRARGLSPTGVVNAATWRVLVDHFERPNFNLASLCAYATGANGNTAHWGTSSTIAHLTLGAGTVYGMGYGPVAVGDISLRYGGAITGHRTHRVGLDADVRPMRIHNDQCSRSTTWYRWSNGHKVCCNPGYDRAATRALIKAIRAASAGHLDVVAFNDPKLIAEGLTMHLAGHDDHLHFSFCEYRHPTWGYTC
ncbi:MAG: penicillin-insensitive murein endopeptidase [Chloroflexota bacterium]